MTEYNKEELKQLKVDQLRQIGKNKSLLRVDRNKKKELIDRIIKGIQLTDESKTFLLEQAKGKNLRVNNTMTKKKLLEINKNPKLTDYNDDG